MNKSYNHFNHWVWKRYIDRNVPNEQGTLCFDEHDWKESGYDDVYFPCVVEKDWSYFLKRDPNYNNIPLYFGLIALQCLAASCIENNIIVEKFLNISGIDSVSEFQKKCKELTSYKGEIYSVQETIWLEAKEYFLTNNKIEIIIPDPKYFTGRYVQYPKSQVILNKDDLKEYITLLFVDLASKYGENSLSIGLFSQYLHNIDGTFKRDRNKKILPTTIQERIKLLQIFNYYNSREWTVELQNEGKKLIDEKSLMIVYDAARSSVQFRNGLWEERTGINVLYKEVKGKNFILFEQHEIYEDEFFRINEVEGNDRLYIVFGWKKLIDVIKGGNSIGSTNQTYAFRLISGRELLANSFLRIERQKYNNFKIQGFRINKRNEFLPNVGPEIISPDSHYNVYYKQELVSYNPYSCEPGKYVIRKAGYTDIHFTIRAPSVHFINTNVNTLLGIRLDNLQLDSISTRLVGLKFIDESVSKGSELTINNWMKVANKSSHIRKKNSKNSFLNLVRQYGC